MKKTIPFIDLHKQYLSIKEEINFAIDQVINNSAFIRGQFVDQFEKDFSNLIGVDHTISCGNGTDSLYIAMKALELSSDDEVIVPAHSWISTSEAVTQAGGRVVFCDTLPDTFLIDPREILKKITDKTVGIIPVHLYGQAAEMDQIMSIASKHNLWVIEDCAQAHLAKYKDQEVGTFGDFGSFSFYPGKNLGAMGDAGALITNSPRLANNARRFARHGGLVKGEHEIEGINSRLDGIQAAILSVKIKHIKEWTIQRQNAANVYKELLSGIREITLPKVYSTNTHVWHQFTIKLNYRDELSRHLLSKGIPTSINYPIALPFLKAYKKYKFQEQQFPNAFANQSQILSLPIYPEITFQDQKYISKSIEEFFIK